MVTILKMLALIAVLLCMTSMLHATNGRFFRSAQEEKVESLALHSEQEREPYLSPGREKEEEEEENLPLARYKDRVKWFCRYLAETQHMIDAMEQGVEIESRRLIFAMSMARQYKAALIKEREAMGFDKDLSAFSSDHRFAGFALKGGRLFYDEGADKNCVEKVTRKWLKGFPAQYDAFHFETASLITALDQPLCDEYYPKEWQIEWKRGRMRETGGKTNGAI